jgi:hypothetical protein
MGRIVFINGFGNSLESSEETTHRLAEATNFDDSVAFTAGEARENPEAVAKAARGAHLFTHSWGIRYAIGTRPEALHVFCPSLPLSRRELWARTKLNRAAIAEEYPTDELQAQIASEQNARELKRHLGGYAIDFLLHMPKFNGLEVAIDAVASKIPTGVAFADRDSYFQPTDEQVNGARSRGVSVARIAGVHPVLIYETERALSDYLYNRTMNTA